MNQKLCILICFFVGVLVYYLLKNTCGCKVVEGGPSPECTCDNGTPSTGTSCPSGGGNYCQSCITGYKINQHSKCIDEKKGCCK